LTPQGAYKSYIFSLKNRSTLKTVGKAWRRRFWTFSASLRTIPASDCPKKIYFGRYQIYRLCLSGTVRRIRTQRETQGPGTRIANIMMMVAAGFGDTRPHEPHGTLRMASDTVRYSILTMASHKDLPASPPCRLASADSCPQIAR
jgi:hypothetical protein